MRAAADALDGSLTVVSVDDSDVRELNASIKRSFANAELQEGSRWKDAGYYLVPLLLLLLLPFFRQGGSVSLGGRQGAG
jgi:Ca-activated chloride channel family protein